MTDPAAEREQVRANLRLLEFQARWAGRATLAAITLATIADIWEWSRWIVTAGIAIAILAQLVVLFLPRKLREHEARLDALRTPPEPPPGPRPEIHPAPQRRDPATWPHSLDFWREGEDGTRHVLIPDIGDASETVEIVRWIADRGDPVRALQPLAEVMYDSVTVEIHAPTDGTLEHLDLEAGQTARVADTLCRLVPPLPGK